MPWSPSTVRMPLTAAGGLAASIADLVEDLTRVSRGYRDDSQAVDEADDPATADGRDRELMDAVRDAGAVLAGRRTAEQAGHWGGDHHGMGVPIFVVSRRAPSAEAAASGPPTNAWLTPAAENPETGQ